MLNIPRDKCSACFACRNVCPKNAVDAERDPVGFLVPQINENLCVDCNLCRDVCAVETPPELTPPKCAKLFVHNDKDVLRRSTSGGAFTAISDLVLENNGAVVAAAMDETFHIRHAVAESKDERDRMRGSLYAQSDVGLLYRDVKDLLDQGRQTLFVGTPCQVGALKLYLKRPYENLALVDFLCHGTPSDSLFREHIARLERIYGRTAVNYRFRSKEFGWTAALEEIEFQNGVKKANVPVQAFNHFFYRNLSLRASCLNCQYRRPERASDLTIADFWGVEKILGRRFPRGASLVFANSERGNKILNEIAERGLAVDVPLNAVEKKLQATALRPKGDRDAFWNYYRENGYDALVEKYGKRSLKYKTLFELKRLAKKFLAKLLR